MEWGWWGGVGRRLPTHTLPPTLHLPPQQADVYSFGIVMWEMWALRPPYAGIYFDDLVVSWRWLADYWG